MDRLLDRIHVLEGLALIFDDLDRALELIRKSKGKADAAKKLIKEFALDELQADHILELKLYRLAKLEIQAIRDELDEKRTEAERIRALLDDEGARWRLVRSELAEVADAYGDERRSRIIGRVETREFDAEAYIIKERTWVIVSRLGRVKRQGGFSDLSAIRLPEGDEVGWALHTDTRQTVALHTQLGSAYVLRVADIQATTGFGEPIQSSFNFADGERVVGITSADESVHPVPSVADLEGLAEDDPQPPFAVAVTRLGRIVRFPLASHAEVSTRNGRKAVSLARTDEVVGVQVCAGDELVTLATEEGRVLIFKVSEVPPRAGAARGVKAIRLGPKDRVLGFQLTTRKRHGLRAWTTRGREVIVRETSYKPARRGGKGTIVIKQGRLERCEVQPVIIEPLVDEEFEEGAEGFEEEEGGQEAGQEEGVPSE